ncbi:DNA ligase 1 [Penaeus vannamei]|uniref:DNA ligase 1 n=1 Tax=Penaeus vannamei TaxID=6689 RepID=UPI000F692670|nr:transcription termination factor 1-like [Penaeus vannamei]
MPIKVKETKVKPTAMNAETPKKAKKVVEQEPKVEETKVEETATPKKTPKKTGKKTPKKVETEEPKEKMEVEEPKEKMEVEDTQEKGEGGKKAKRRKRKKAVKAVEAETKEIESPPKQQKTKKTQKTGKKSPKEESEEPNENVEGGEKTKKKRKRNRKRKISEKAEDTEAKENESPQKKKKINHNVPDEKVELKGELLDMHTKRKRSICERTVVIRMKKFKQEYVKERPDMCKDALFFGIKFGKLCFLVYKSKEQAEKKVTELKKSPEVNHAWLWKQQEICTVVNPYTLFVEHLPVGTTEEEIKKIFPTATAMHYDSHKNVVNMAFSTKEDAETVFRESENMKMKGVEIIALYGKYGYNWERERRQKTAK